MIHASFALAAATFLSTPGAVEQTDAASPRCEQVRWISSDGLGSSVEELERIAQLTGAAPPRPLLFRRPSELDFPMCEGGRFAAGEVPAPPEPSRQVELRLLPVTSRSYFNSNYPSDKNDGALWAGRGLSTELSAGVSVHWRFLSARFAPTIAWQQNRRFSTPTAADGVGPSLSSWPGFSIDLPTRMGTEAFWTLDPGQSSVRAEAFNVALGFSTENLWWGPGIRHSVILSNTGPSFPHAFVGTARPLDVKIGQLEAQLLWGHVDESAYFDTDPSNDRRLLSALNLGFSPRFWPGMHLGVARVYLYTLTPGQVSARDYLVPLFEPFLKKDIATEDNPSGNRRDNQLLSLFARYVLPGAGAEVYTEWARDDHSWHFEDLAMEPGHSQAFILGGQKVFPLERGWLRLQAELVHLVDSSADRVWRLTPAFYTHYAVLQGYTHRGQMLGDWLGPGGSGQVAALDYIVASSRTGLFFERSLRDELYYLKTQGTLFGHDLELTAGLRQAYDWGQFGLGAEASFSRRWNRAFGPHDRNWNARLSLTWYPERRMAPTLPAPLSTWAAPPGAHAAAP